MPPYSLLLTAADHSADVVSQNPAMHPTPVICIIGASRTAAWSSPYAGAGDGRAAHRGVTRHGVLLLPRSLLAAVILTLWSVNPRRRWWRSNA